MTAPSEINGNGAMPETKMARTREVIFELLSEHEETENGLPTTIRFLFYELEQRGLAVKPDRDGPRQGKRRSVGWPPGSQDITDAVTQLREDGWIPWHWIADTERSVDVWRHSPNVRAFLNDELNYFRLNPWEPDEPPLILTESKGNAEVLRRIASEYCCPISGLKGHAAGHLRTEIAPLFEGNDRAVLYLGDFDRSGFDIENNAREVLESAIERNIKWERIALTQAQIDARNIEPIWKIDGRDGKGLDAWECEALGQAGVVVLVRQTLKARLRRGRRGRTLASVQERERRQISAARAMLREDGQ
jgi:hypothetical protein